MQSFEFFNNNWVEYNVNDVSLSTRKLKVNLPNNFFDELSFDKDSLRNYRTTAATLVSKSLGSRPALCLSGGVDSQAMVYSWLEAGLNFEVVALVFDNGLNYHDVETAYQFCKAYNLPIREIPLNVTQFLNRENVNYAIMYKSASPQFNVHYKLFNMLKDVGYTGACCGGVAIFQDNGLWGNNFRRNIFNFINYVDISGFPVQGSFLSYYPYLTWAIGLLTKPLDIPIKKELGDHLFKQYEDVRYQNKVEGYTRAGLKIIPQKLAYTGFEKVKDFYESITKDGWEFEKRFRFPLQSIHKIYKNNAELVELDLNDTQLSKISSIYSHNMRSGRVAPSGI